MTTNIRVVAARDLFVDNEVFLLPRGQYPSTPALGGIAWLRREPPGHAHLMALTTAVAAIKRALPTYRLSLLGVTRRRSRTVRFVIVDCGNRSSREASAYREAFGLRRCLPRSGAGSNGAAQSQSMLKT